MRQRTIGPALSGLGEGLAGRDVLALATSVVGRAQCMLTQSPGVRCSLRHIDVAGFRVKWALCQEAARLSWIVFRRTYELHLSRVRTGVAVMRQD
jgi:hypothetical protein